MITIYDELPHASNSDPLWRESWYLNFFDHSSEVYGIAWMGIRPMVGHGEILFALCEGPEFLHIMSDFTIPITADIGAERQNFGPLRWEVVEPFERWTMHFDDGKCRVHLEWEAVTPVYSWEWQDLAASWHFEHPGRVTGYAEVGDRRISIEGYGERDRAWGRRDNTMFETVHWTVGQFNSGTYFHGMQLVSKGKEVLLGFQQIDGDPALLSDYVLDLDYAYRGGPPRAAHLEATDELGRTLVIEQELLNVIPFVLADSGHQVRQYFTFNRLTCNGERGYGMMDHWWSDPTVLSAHHRANGRNRGALFDAKGLVRAQL
jgi:hypothetical protein